MYVGGVKRDLHYLDAYLVEVLFGCKISGFSGFGWIA